MKPMKLLRRLFAIASVGALVGLTSTIASAQGPVIVSFSQNGELVCTNLVPGTPAIVEWAPSVEGPWMSGWGQLQSVLVDSNGTIRVKVPMFYRVRGLTVNPEHSTLIWVPPGTFTMGSPTNEQGRLENEGPQTEVTISRGFWMGKHEVTQTEYLAIMGNNPSQYNWDGMLPVSRVRWGDATNYCARLTQRERENGRIAANSVYRLPTEAEWEYACRAGTSTRFHYGDDPGYVELADHAWYVGNSFVSTYPVGRKLPNPWGLYDMYGNVWEWCQDYASDAYFGGSLTDPQGPETGDLRILRGGGWESHEWSCRSAMRSGDRALVGESGHIGFRVVLDPGQP